MSRETAQWLNENIRIGNTAKRGQAWWYDADLDTVGSHYEGPVPVEVVRNELFDWEPTIVPLTGLVGPDGQTYGDPNRIAIGHPKTGKVLGVFTTGYVAHSYADTLLDKVAMILDDNLNIGSAGLLREGARAWCTVEMDDTVHGPGGIDFRPFLTAATSFDGSLSTTYQLGNQLPVCDNTLAAALGATDALRVKIRHSAPVEGKLADVKDALQLLTNTADTFAAELEALLSEKVSETRFNMWVDVYSGMASKAKDNVTAGRGFTMASNKRDKLIELWSNDPMVNPWRGTAFGVLQTANTFETHWSSVRNVTRAERNMTRTVDGEWAKIDAAALKTLAAV
jgi:phage/plasmid-like protein (TIGR03299 family)